MCRFSWIMMMFTVNIMVKPKILSYTTSIMVLILDISLFPTDNFEKISWGRSCNHGISALASLFVIKNNTWVRNCLIWHVIAITMCLKTVYNEITKMLWSSSLGRTGSRLFVTIELICRGNRSCIMEISLLFFAICHVQHFENGLVGVKYGQIFIVKIIISHKEPARIYEMWVLSCLWLY